MSILAIDDVLEHAVEVGDVPNVVAIAADRGGLIYYGAVGPRTVGDDVPISAGSRIQIASMTKMVATVAALQQVERDNLALDVPVDHYLPEFADVGVLVDFEGNFPRLRPPKTTATVRQLITHTAGFGYRFFNANIRRWEEVTGTPHGASGSSQIFAAPMVSDPGTQFEYGISTDWLGRIVEVISGQPLDAYLKEHVFDPLAMHATTFSVTCEQRPDFAPTHIRGEAGSWVSMSVGGNREPEYFSAGSGLYSTPSDYLSFQRMLLGAGTLGDVTILQPATVESIFTNQIGELNFPAGMVSLEPSAISSLNFGPGFKWGLGLLLNTEQQAGMRAMGSGGWFGVRNSHFWIDSASGVTAAIYMQCMPLMEPGALRTCISFERALYASM
jgi:methyl acetate hydrolase